MGSPNFSPRRVAIMLASCFAASLPLAMWQYTVSQMKRAEEERVHQEKLQKSVEQIREAVREGKAGDAFNRLFAEDFQEHERRKANEQNSGQGGGPNTDEDVGHERE